MTNFLRWTIYLSLGAIPFLAFYVAGEAVPESWRMFFPYISGKNFLFRILVEVAAAAWLMLMIIDERYRPKKAILLYAYSIFIFVLFLADFFSVDPLRSFFSNFERMEGFISHLHLFFYFLILLSVYRTREHLENYKFLFLLSNLPVLILAYLQLLGTSNVFTTYIPTLRDRIHQSFAPSQGGTQLDSSLGNSTYLAIYVVFFIFLFFISLIQNKLQNRSLVFPGLMVVLNLIVLNYTGTRGAQVGFVIGVLVTSCIVFFAGKKFPELKRTRNWALGLFLVVILSLAFLISIHDTELTRNNPRLSRLSELANFMNPVRIYTRVSTIKKLLYEENSTYQDLLTATLNQGTFASRFLNIKMSLDGWKERPILGWGQDNYLYVFSKYHDARMYAQEPWFDRSHNVFMDWLIAAGILGLLAYLSLYVAAIYLLWFSRTKKVHRDSSGDFLEKSLLTGLLVAYFVHNIFVFDNLISYILFFFLLAYLTLRFDYSIDLGGGNLEKKSTKNIEDKILIYGPFVLVSLFLALYFLNIRYLIANFAISQGKSFQQKPEDKTLADVLNRSLANLQKAVEIGGIAAIEAREQLAEQTLGLLNELKNRNIPQNEEGLKVYQAVINFMNATKLNYLSLLESQKGPDPRSFLIYSHFARNVGDQENALKYSRLAYEYAPRQQLIALNYIESLFAGKNYTEALSVAEKTYRSDPTFEPAKNTYALLLAYNQKYEEALKLVPSLSETVSTIKKERQGREN